MKQIKDFITESLLGDRRAKREAINAAHQHKIDGIISLFRELNADGISFRMTHVAPEDITEEIEAQYAQEAQNDWEVYQSTRHEEDRKTWDSISPEEQKTIIAAYIHNNDIKTTKLAYDTVIDSTKLQDGQALNDAFYDRINGLQTEELFFTIDNFDELNAEVQRDAKGNIFKGLFWMQQNHGDRASILYDDLYDNIDIINYVILGAEINSK